VKSRLERSTTNRVIGGVCGGIAEYLAVDATLVRVAFVFTAFITAGLFVLAYIVLLVLMPQPGQPAPFTSAPPHAPTDTAPVDPGSAPAAPATLAPVDPAVHAAEADRRRMAFGYILIAIGVAFLLTNAGVFRFVQWQFLWPLVLIGIGVLFLVQRVRT
jgi:phage shock protein C